jgi:formamidopyrimidine-DNA glycosylase
MPELPEVEVISRGLRPLLTNRRIVSLWRSGKDLRTVVPWRELQSGMTGRKIVGISRRAKYIKIVLDSGAMLIIHLGMTGNLGVFPDKSKRKPHDHLEWQLDDGTKFRLSDVRRFGSVQFLEADSVQKREKIIFHTTGPEPFDHSFSADYLYKLARNRKLTVKQFIMTNQVVAGIGNIYANESLFNARLRPERSIASLTRKNWTDLIRSIRMVLDHAIDCGGSTISDFRNASQRSGYFQVNFKVYGKAGQGCTVCSSEIQKKVIGGRASFFCPDCQK